MPMVLFKSAPAPVAVFSFPVLRRSVPAPTAVLYVPVVRLRRALCPSAVLPPGYPPSGAGTTASAIGASPKQASAMAMSSMFIDLIGFCLGCFFIFLSLLLILIYCFCGFWFRYAQARFGPNLRVVENAGFPYESL